MAILPGNGCLIKLILNLIKQELVMTSLFVERRVYAIRRIGEFRDLKFNLGLYLISQIIMKAQTTVSSVISCHYTTGMLPETSGEAATKIELVESIARLE